MTAPPPVAELRATLRGRTLPGATLPIERYESAIADHALRATDADSNLAHPLWLVIASLRGLGISVEELSELAAKGPGDTLLFGGVTIEHQRPMAVGGRYRTSAQIDDVGRRRTRAGKVLDSVVVTVLVTDDEGTRYGTVTSTYLFMRSS